MYIIKFGILILAILVAGCSQVPNEYPTRIIKLKTSSIEVAKNFDVLTIQIIESDRSIYSITAEKKFKTSALCYEEFQNLYQLYNAKYAHLKQTKKLNVGNKVINSDDGSKHLQLLGCSVDDKGIHQLELSL